MRAPKVLSIRLVVASLGIAGLWLAWSQTTPPAQPLTMQKVTDNLYVLIGDGGNAAFMPTSEGVILVDDKFAQDGPQILAKVKSVTDKPIRYVLNTHQHGDHTGGNEALLAANAEIVIHKNARANMVTNKQPGLPHITFSDETQVFAGGKEVLARYLGRGHTNGDAVIYFPSERVLHAGDLLTSGAPFCDTANGGSIKEWDQTLQKALQYDFDTVIPGHGPVMKRTDLEKYVHTVATIRDRVKQACAGGAADAVKRIDLKDLGFSTAGMFERGVAGMCQELAR
jgi:glyoxylase-like metal-dependent hydrolase (beta-lactamase superfamily II)